uniref:Uncharacterized protein n=1 Tax=Panthera leo TaxID=9689 RepID=A0A8C8XTG0_PANLE
MYYICVCIYIQIYYILIYITHTFHPSLEFSHAKYLDSNRQNRGTITALDGSSLPVASPTQLGPLPHHPMWWGSPLMATCKERVGSGRASKGMEGLSALGLIRGYALVPWLLCYGSLEKECSPGPAKSSVLSLSSSALSRGFPTISCCHCLNLYSQSIFTFFPTFTPFTGNYTPSSSQ